MEEDNINWEEHGLMSDKELDKIDENFKRTEIEGVQNILKYFDRIHDKLFAFNNILIGGFFILSQIYDSFSTYGIIIPLVNLAILLFIEYRMMNKSRFEADVRKKTPQEIENHGITINKTNLYSLLAIFSTVIVLAFFITNIVSLKNRKDSAEEIKNTAKQEQLNINAFESSDTIIKGVLKDKKERIEGLMMKNDTTTKSIVHLADSTKYEDYSNK
jgi:hypothetical protein